MILNSNQHQLVIGSLLGDAGINKDKRYEGYEFAERHSLKQIEYLKWKRDILNFNFKTYEDKNLCTLRKNNKVFKKYRKEFYDKGIKKVKREILDKLTPFGIAVWHMDDGDYNYKTETVRLATHSFKKEGNEIIAEYLKQIWNIEPKITSVFDKRQNKEYHHLEFTRENKNKYINLIKKYILPSMEYKIGLDQEKRKIAQRKKKEYNKKWWADNEDKRKEYYQQWKKRNKL